MSLIKRLQEPFPERGDLPGNVKYLIGVGVFVAAFLFILRPFGIEGTRDDLLFVCLGFGLVTIICGVLLEIVLRHVIGMRTDTAKWTLGKWILVALCNLIWIAFGNLLYVNIILDRTAFELEHFGSMLLNTLVVGFFPVVFSGLMIQVRALRTNQKTAADMRASPDKESAGQLALDGLNAAILFKNLLYIESAQNYVTIHHFDNGQIEKELIRVTMNALEGELLDSTIVRCHRSFYVNVDHVEDVKGNAQGLKLHLKNVDGIIPVSRRYIPHLKSLMKP